MIVKSKKFLNYSTQSIDKNDINQVVKVLKSNFLTQGPNIQDFEKKFARTVGSKYAVACSNGTAALHLSLLALGINSKKTLLTSPITFLASANCIEFLNGKTLFADINDKSFCLCPIELEKNLKKYKIDVVVAVHMAGHSAEMNKIHKLKKKYNFKLIEDSCHALGGFYKNKPVGCSHYSDLSTFSFHPVKPITTGEGGMITTNSSEYYKKLILYRTHGMHKNSDQFKNKKLAFDKNGNVNQWYYEMNNVGYNYRMTDIQAALGLSQISKLKKFTKKRNAIASYYYKHLKENKYIKIFKPNKNIYHAYHLFVILVDFKKINKTRYEVMQFLKDRNIGTQVLYIPLHYQPYYKKKYNYKKGNFPKSEKYYDSCLSIPIFPDLKKSDLKFIVDTINKIICKN